MGHKSNPVGFRIGVNVDWRSLWYSRKDYGRLVLEDKKIRDLILKKAGEAGVNEIRIERLPGVKIIISVVRPGMVIGRGGSGLIDLREIITREVGAKVELVVEDVKNPELKAKIVADEIARSILRRVPVRRIMHQAVEKVMAKGARGVKIVVAGVISGPSSISRSERIVRGSVPSQTLRSNIEFARGTAFTSYGTLGIKVWIFLGEKDT